MMIRCVMRNCLGGDHRSRLRHHHRCYHPDDDHYLNSSCVPNSDLMGNTMNHAKGDATTNLGHTMGCTMNSSTTSLDHTKGRTMNCTKDYTNPNSIASLDHTKQNTMDYTKGRQPRPSPNHK